ncbi:MAG TPA: aa3-type cytochrome c oxidase subunit IV [Caulobacteraceae bacterium]
MAGHDDSHGDYKPGSMDISQHVKAYAGFLTFTKWSLIGILLIMVFMAFFRTH